MIASRKPLIIFMMIILVLAGIGAYTWYSRSGNRIVLKIFSAGSLSLTLREAEGVYEEQNPMIDIQSEFSGSVFAVKKVVELHQWADIVFSADYKLLKEYMLDKGYAEWVVSFASNELVLAYTDRSRYADVVNSSNWYRILMKPGVKYGFSNPNADPCGYRALSILYMASLYYNDTDIWDKLVREYIKNIVVKGENNTYTIYYPASPDYTPGKLVIRDKSVDLISLLEAGELDYAFEYRSVAVEHGLKYIELPPEINLAYKPFLNMSIVLYHGSSSERKVVIEEIRYGLTIPSTAKHVDEALEFIKWILYGDGAKILDKHGFRRINYIYLGNPPKQLTG